MQRRWRNISSSVKDVWTGLSNETSLLMHIRIFNKPVSPETKKKERKPV